jgi:glutamate-ammonia-ligase adenylyltransferase
LNSLSFEDQLRVERNEIWSRWAQAAKENSQPPSDICHSWSEASDILLKKAYDHCFPNQKVALFALGKLGSKELNLSSDVDLILISEEATSEALTGLRKFQKVLQERTGNGFVFRLDFDLRPGGKQGPLIPTIDQFKDYYGNYGETWERLAFVRLRPIAGNAAIISDILAFAKKFSFRKHLDFTLFEDLKHLRSKIQSHYWSRSQENQIDLKLGIGGIRDVELFAHALQVVHGGKDSSLQVYGTTEALRLLADKSLLPPEEAHFLETHYWNLRRLENYVQALRDEQTHLLKLDETHPEFVTEAIKTLREQMAKCDGIVRSLLGEAAPNVSLEEELSSYGLESAELQSLWQEILEQEVLSRNKSRDELSRKAFLLEFLETLKRQGGDVKRALLLLKDFVAGTRAKASFFSLLLREKNLLQEITWLFGHSPYLSRILCSRPELLDSFVYRSQNSQSEDMAQLLESLTEKRLLSEIINGSEFLEDKNLPPLLENLTSTADAIVLALLNELKKEHPSDIRILALGKWGGRELGFRSDLDFIFVLPNEPSDQDFKIARRFISRLTEPHRGGSIYPIDMRLRPSGKAGPLVMPLSDLQTYLQTEAVPWERQAYLKARWIGEPLISLPSLYIQKGLNAEELQELDRIRQGLLKSSTVIDLKYSEGALVDLELASQALILEKKIALTETSSLSFIRKMGEQSATLASNYDRLRQIEQMLQLVASESLSELNLNDESFPRLAMSLHLSPNQLLQEVSDILAVNCVLLKNLDPRRGPH